MKFSGICKISVLAQNQHILVAPLVFLWINALHPILGIEIQPLTALLVGAVISIYQQTTVQCEDFADGFFEYCKFNEKNLLNYTLAKAVSIWLTTIFPKSLILLVFGFSTIQIILITVQWMVLNICTACLITLTPTIKFNANPLNLLLACLPLLTAPIIFLTDYLHHCNKNSLMIFLGCDTMLLCAIFLPFYFSNHKV